MDYFYAALPFIKKYRLELLFLLISLIIIGIALLLFFTNHEPKPLLEKAYAQSHPNTDMQTPSETKKIVVDVSGAVNHPNIYEVAAGTRLKEVLNMAGGLSENSDRIFFYRNINSAKILQDQEKIYIPSIDETSQGLFTDTFNKQPDVSDPDNNNPNVEININSATLQQLDALPTVGQTTAQKIIDNRPYNSIDDLLSKKIIKQSTYDKIKNLVTF